MCLCLDIVTIYLHAIYTLHTTNKRETWVVEGRGRKRVMNERGCSSENKP